MTKKVFYKHLNIAVSGCGYRELYFDEAGEACRNLVLNYLSSCQLWAEAISEAPFIGPLGEVEITNEEWDNLLINKELLGVEFAEYPLEEE